jgi:MOSC domain-containing protein YiiM
MTVSPQSIAHLEAALDEVRRSPADRGTVELIVRRPAEDLRESLAEGILDVDEGLVGDRWFERHGAPSRSAADGRETQVTLMNARVAAVLAEEAERRALAGDQLFVDLDLSEDNLPPGTRFSVGTGELEVTPRPHRGCQKFSDRFGAEALQFVNTPEGRRMRLRGMYARVVTGGVVRVGDAVRKLPP